MFNFFVFYFKFFHLIFSSSLIYHFYPSVDSDSFFSSGFKAFKVSTCFIPWSSFVFICFSNSLSRAEYVNFACSIILLWSDGNITSPVRYSYLSILPYDNADIFAASLLILYCSFSSFILSSIVMISFIFFLKDTFWNVKNYLMQEYHQ